MVYRRDIEVWYWKHKFLWGWSGKKKFDFESLSPGGTYFAWTTFQRSENVLAIERRGKLKLCRVVSIADTVFLENANLYVQDQDARISGTTFQKSIYFFIPNLAAYKYKSGHTHNLCDIESMKYIPFANLFCECPWGMFLMGRFSQIYLYLIKPNQIYKTKPSWARYSEYHLKSI